LLAVGAVGVGLEVDAVDAHVLLGGGEAFEGRLVERLVVLAADVEHQADLDAGAIGVVIGPEVGRCGFEAGLALAGGSCSSPPPSPPLPEPPSSSSLAQLARMSAKAAANKRSIRLQRRCFTGFSLVFTRPPGCVW
jgi:hypothetical protein